MFKAAATSNVAAFIVLVSSVYTIIVNREVSSIGCLLSCPFAYRYTHISEKCPNLSITIAQILVISSLYLTHGSRQRCLTNGTGVSKYGQAAFS